MAKLGSAFSDKERRKSAVRRLTPGTVICLKVAFPQGTKLKYLVVAHVEHESCTFIINSRIRPFIKARQSLSVCQVSIDAARHKFLKRDSYISCHEILRLPTEKVISELVADMEKIKGRLHKEVATEVIAAVKRAPTLSPVEQSQIAVSLDVAYE